MTPEARKILEEAKSPVHMQLTDMGYRATLRDESGKIIREDLLKWDEYPTAEDAVEEVLNWV